MVTSLSRLECAHLVLSVVEQSWWDAFPGNIFGSGWKLILVPVGESPWLHLQNMSATYYK